MISSNDFRNGVTILIEGQLWTVIEFLHVKPGKGGAFMRTRADAVGLAELLVRLAYGCGRRASAVVTDMEEPLALTVGTGAEAVEARDFLRGDTRPGRLRALVKAMAHALLSTRISASQAEQTVEEALRGTAALSTFEAMIAAQGGDVECFRRLQALAELPILAPAAGFIAAIDCVDIGNLARELVARHGAFAGVRIDASRGDRVESGQPLGVVDGEAGADAQRRRVRHVAVPALLDGELGRSELVVQELQLEVLARVVGDRVNLVEELP